MNINKLLPISMLSQYELHLTLSTSYTDEHAAKCTRLITGDHERLSELHQVLRKLESTLASKPYTGDDLYSLYIRLLPALPAAFDHRMLHPDLRLLAAVGQQAEQYKPISTDLKDTATFQFIVGLVEGRCSASHQQVVADWERESTKNRLAAFQALEQICRHSPSFVSVGIELTYVQPNISLKRITEDCQQLLDGMRAIPGLEHCVGAMWQLGYARLKGYYLQMIFFCSAGQAGTGPVLAQCLGEHWQQTVTKGDGRYFIDTRERTVYEYPGCLYVTENDKAMLEQVELMLKFVTEADLYAPMVLPKAQPTFGIVSLYADVV
ncbi:MULTISPECIES: hypothetical protein [unclassified Serratia (in: enterobacteria)]|uniref:hypothetical protein n=1 Tax=unclassified Serratia (in: enterobacteria) TaxID=2647522 RepID=UPI0005050085|nr:MULTISPECIES: hypothetical protein [unclassified Serratia (in: enterobacteria)]KFK97743.1 hypothetical protein JV45_00130 [Serratia sp. Ag2]KFL00134.1 hypothetical protein IV04_01440 [Serratia sp. Ag1]